MMSLDDTMDLTQARNFRKVSDRLLTCGQPSEAQLASARATGVEVVINLALHDDPRYSLKDERGCVESLGMTYVHIPVQFSAPTRADLLAFFSAMDAHPNQSILVHCGANYRVTAFLGLYNVLRLGQSPEEAFALMDSVWKPDPVWTEFIRDMLSRHVESSRRLISSGSTFEEQIGYSRAVVQGDWVFVSGTTGFDYSTMTIPESIEAQAGQCLKNIESALAQAGSSLRDVVRVTYVVPDGSEFEKCWPVLREYFGEVRPAATMISAALLDPRMRIEIEVTALKQSKRG